MRDLVHCEPVAQRQQIGVVVANVSMNSLKTPSTSTRTHAVMLALCTSSPQQRAIIVCIEPRSPLAR